MESAELINAYRLRKELTFKQLGAQFGVGKATAYRWATGERRPDVEFVPVISGVTGIPPDKLRPDLAFMFAAANRKRRNTA